MANDNNIKNYTAADIAKYHQGLLSNKEMHDLEKTALDDPFLTDALEGYAVTGVNASNDIIELKKRLEEKIEGAKIIPLNTKPRNSFRLLRAVAIIIFVVSAGLLVYQFGFNKKSGEIAQAKNQKEEVVKAADSAVTTNQTVTSTPAAEDKNSFSKPEQKRTKDQSTAGKKEAVPGAEVPKQVTTRQTVTDDVVINKSAEPVVTAPAKGAGEKNILSRNSTEKKEVVKEAKTEANNKIAGNTRQQKDKEAIRDQASQENEDLNKNRTIASTRKADEQNYRNQRNNTFRGRVTDATNMGVPFANVTNVQDNAGTYTDANGNFLLTSPDSILTVQVRSIGFENNNAQLKNDIASNRVILQDDRRSLSEVVVSNQKPNTAARSNTINIKVEEPEPTDGWDNYDAYLVNNLNVPEEYKTKQNNSASVQLSFEVDKNGEPINIKIEKSLCPTCDKEAIRLVKDGPKWKRKAKKGRTTVTVPFNTSF